MKAKEYNGENEAINQFIIEMTLINPVKDIIKKLKNNEFRDCDINLLNKKLRDFTMFSCKTLNINVSLNNLENKMDGVVMNSYVSNMYISRFETLLKYFESI